MGGHEGDDAKGRRSGFEGQGGFPESGAGGCDIIDEEYCRYAGELRGVGRKSSGDVLFAEGMVPGFALRRGIPRAAEDIGPEGQPETEGDLARDELGLVVAALPRPIGAEGDGDDDRASSE